MVVVSQESGITITLIYILIAIVLTMRWILVDGPWLSNIHRCRKHLQA